MPNASIRVVPADEGLRSLAAHNMLMAVRIDFGGFVMQSGRQCTIPHKNTHQGACILSLAFTSAPPATHRVSVFVPPSTASMQVCSRRLPWSWFRSGPPCECSPTTPATEYSSCMRRYGACNHDRNVNSCLARIRIPPSCADGRSRGLGLCARPPCLRRLQGAHTGAPSPKTRHIGSRCVSVPMSSFADSRFVVEAALTSTMAAMLLGCANIEGWPSCNGVTWMG